MSRGWEEGAEGFCSCSHSYSGVSHLRGEEYMCLPWSGRGQTPPCCWPRAELPSWEQDTLWSLSVCTGQDRWILCVSCQLPQKAVHPQSRGVPASLEVSPSLCTRELVDPCAVNMPTVLYFSAYFSDHRQPSAEGWLFLSLKRQCDMFDS